MIEIANRIPIPITLTMVDDHRSGHNPLTTVNSSLLNPVSNNIELQPNNVLLVPLVGLYGIGFGAVPVNN